MSSVTLKGDPVEIGGQFPEKGASITDFNLANQKRENMSLESYAGKRKILNIFPSIDTEVPRLPSGHELGRMQLPRR